MTSRRESPDTKVTRSPSPWSHVVRLVAYFPLISCLSVSKLIVSNCGPGPASCPPMYLLSPSSSLSWGPWEYIFQCIQVLRDCDVCSLG